MYKKIREAIVAVVINTIIMIVFINIINDYVVLLSFLIYSQPSLTLKKRT